MFYLCHPNGSRIWVLYSGHPQGHQVSWSKSLPSTVCLCTTSRCASSFFWISRLCVAHCQASLSDNLTTTQLSSQTAVHFFFEAVVERSRYSLRSCHSPSLIALMIIVCHPTTPLVSLKRWWISKNWITSRKMDMDMHTCVRFLKICCLTHLMHRYPYCLPHVCHGKIGDPQYFSLLKNCHSFQGKWCTWGPTTSRRNK